jgi:diketogulonate reductase-like aldo/keto reductase
LLGEPVLDEIATNSELPLAGVVLAWNVTIGVVPPPSSNTGNYIIENLAAGAHRLTADGCSQIAELREPAFER